MALEYRERCRTVIPKPFLGLRVMRLIQRARILAKANSQKHPGIGQAGGSRNIPSDFKISHYIQKDFLEIFNFVLGSFFDYVKKLGEFDFVVGGSCFVMLHHLALLPLPLGRRQISIRKFGGLPKAHHKLSEEFMTKCDYVNYKKQVLGNWICNGKNQW